MTRQRWRFEGVEIHGGRRVAVIRDRDRDELARVYFARGLWRRWEVGYGDGPAGAGLAAVARRGLANQERIGAEPVALEEVTEAEPDGPACEAVRLFDAPQGIKGQLGLDTD